MTSALTLRSWLHLALLVLVTTSCTSLEVHQLRDTEPAPPDGTIPYALPEKSFLITVTERLTGCHPPDASLNVLDVQIDASVTPVTQPDPSHRYFIDYRDLRSIFKDTTFAIDSYDGQTLKTFNGTVNDQGGPILVATIKTVIQVAAISSVALAVNGVSHRAQSLPKTPCNDDTVRALETVTKAEKVDSAAYKNAVEQLIVKRTTTWTPAPSEVNTLLGDRRGATVRIELPTVEAQTKWLQYPQWLSFVESNGGLAVPNVYAEVAGDHRFVPMPPATPSQLCKAATEKERARCEGFVLRNPPPMLLRICKAACPQNSDRSVGGDVLYAADAVVPQLGSVVVLPLENRMWENSNLIVNLSQDGVLTKLSVQSNTTAATGIQGLGQDADALKSALGERTKALNDARAAQQNETHDANKRLWECIDFQNKIRAAGGTPVGVCD